MHKLTQTFNAAFHASMRPRKVREYAGGLGEGLATAAESLDGGEATVLQRPPKMPAAPIPVAPSGPRNLPEPGETPSLSSILGGATGLIRWQTQGMDEATQEQRRRKAQREEEFHRAATPSVSIQQGIQDIARKRAIRDAARRAAQGAHQQTEQALKFAATEAVDQPPWVEGPHGLRKSVNVGGNPYLFSSYPTRHLPMVGYDEDKPEVMHELSTRGLGKPHQFEFEFGDDENSPFSVTGVTGTGHAGAVMSHAREAMRQLLAKHRPAAVVFAAKEPSRRKLYEHLLRRAAGKSEYRPFRLSALEDQGHQAFALAHEALVPHLPPGAEEIRPPQPKTQRRPTR